MGHQRLIAGLFPLLALAIFLAGAPHGSVHARSTPRLNLAATASAVLEHVMEAARQRAEREAFQTEAQQALLSVLGDGMPPPLMAVRPPIKAAATRPSHTLERSPAD